MSQSNPTIVAHLQKIVPQALVDLCEAGMRETYWTQFDYEVVAYGSRQQRSDHWSFVDMPSSYRSRDISGANQGVFQGLNTNQIFAMAFEPDAIDFLLKHAYNQYVLWSNTRDLCNWLFAREPIDQVTLPYTLDKVKERLYGNKTPFGVKTSPYTNHNIALLKQAIVAQGGTLDPNKLNAAYAFDLIRLGLILRVKREEFQAPPTLMLNPFWDDFIKDVTQEAGVTPPSGSLLVAVGSTTGQVRIVPESGYTAQQVADLLSSGRARISNDSVLLPAPAPAEGMSNIAKVLDPRPSVTQTGRVFWTVVN